jgi:glyoxylase-like metal-dependent hydrolase (beta-lactamase superfamily II)
MRFGRCDRTGTLGLMARPPHYDTTDVRIDKIVVGPFENNVFVLRCKSTGDAVLVDAANEHDLLLEVSRATGVRRVLTTHGHFDHIQAVTQMRDAGIDVGVAEADAAMLPAYDFTIPDDDIIVVGDLRLRTIHTPGHTRGSTCFLLDGHPVLFSGDTLFPGGPGNTKFEGASFPTIITSIDRRLFPLPGETLVLPGHGLDTTIATERPHLQEWVDRGW